MRNSGDPQPSALRPDRYASVTRVLVHVLILNLAVALAKIVFGYTSGAISILSDGFHSLTDAASNIAGLVGVHAARQPPDEDHPYGHRKYETVAAAAVTVFLLLLVIEVIRNAVNHLTGRTQPHEISAASFVVMLVTIAVNLVVVAYEWCKLSSGGTLPFAMPRKSDAAPRQQLLAFFENLEHELEKVEGMQWIRLMYLYPMYFGDELIEKIATSAKPGF